MDYQLVVKFWRPSLSGETFLTTLAEEMQHELGEVAKLDGHDVSDKEINLFVVTPDPKQSFRRLKRVLEKNDNLRGVSAAFRLLGGAQFTSIWPPRAARKFKLP